MAGEMSLERIVEALSRASDFGMDPSLERFVRLMSFMGNPQDEYRSIQVAGTNGKSSTVRLISSILAGHGLKTGLYTSPHLVRYPERIELCGEVIGDAQFVSVVNRVIDSCRDFAEQDGVFEAQTLNHAGKTGGSLTEKSFAGGFTEYEILTAAAFVAFAEAEVDCAVLEVGLGGRWDATTAVHPSVAVITGIGLDHTAILGDSLEKIASEKAAIIEPCSIAVIGPGCSPVEGVILGRVEQTGAKACLVDGPHARLQGNDQCARASYALNATSPRLTLDIQGIYGKYSCVSCSRPRYQAPNIACAAVSAEAALGHALDKSALEAAADKTSIPGRFEALSQDPLLIIDAAHNPQSAHFLAQAIADRFELDSANDRPGLLLAVLEDKDFEGIIDELSGVAGKIYVTQTSSPRAVPAKVLARVVEERAGKAPKVFPDVPSAISALMLKKGPFVATGSITLAGEVAALFA